jgi:hypothetical protein
MDEFKVEHYANFGTGEPWVARLVLGLQELVYAVPAFGATRDAFMNELGEVFESLGMAFEELRSLRKQASEGGAPALDVARSYASLYGYLWQAHKDRFQTAMKPLGLDIGFLFQSDVNFEKRAAERRVPPARLCPDDVRERLAGDRGLCGALRERQPVADHAAGRNPGA